MGKEIFTFYAHWFPLSRSMDRHRPMASSLRFFDSFESFGTTEHFHVSLTKQMYKIPGNNQGMKPV